MIWFATPGEGISSFSVSEVLGDFTISSFFSSSTRFSRIFSIDPSPLFRWIRSLMILNRLVYFPFIFLLVQIGIEKIFII